MVDWGRVAVSRKECVCIMPCGLVGCCSDMVTIVLCDGVGELLDGCMSGWTGWWKEILVVL
jgi:hypothetical protein